MVTTGHAAVMGSLKGFAPIKRESIAEWAEKNMMRDDGRPYSRLRYPQFAAPNGPFDAIGQQRIRSVWLMFASQLGKTFFGQTATAYFADTAPSNQLFASSDKKLAMEVIERYYDCLEHIKPLRRQLRPKHARRQTQVVLEHCRMFVGWSRSVSTLSDKAIKVGHANEIDKWEHSTRSREADPLKLFQDRGKDFQHTKKFIYESTPSIKDQSRIERGYLNSDQRQLYVPCPHCYAYQRLEFGKKDTAFGVKWRSGKHGKHSPSQARKTAYYACTNCSEPILNFSRQWMMNRGVWAPQGCEVDEQKATSWFDGGLDDPACDDSRLNELGLKLLKGNPESSGIDASFRLSTLYALSVDWSDIAEEFVSCRGDAQLLRNFVNQWLAETWEHVVREQTWEQLGDRLILDGKDSLEQGQVPEWASLLTVGIDKQVDHCVFVVKAWGPDRTNHTLDYGEAGSFEELLDRVVTRVYPGVKDAMAPSCTLIDAGFLPDMVHETCDDWREHGYWALPCRGTDQLMACPVKINNISGGPRKGRLIVFIDSYTTQTWLDRMLFGKKHPLPGTMSLFTAPLIAHQNYLRQLLNEIPAMRPHLRTRRLESWDRVDTKLPNDLRDCERYAFAAMLVATGGTPIRPGDKFYGPSQVHGQEHRGARIIGNFADKSRRLY